ncbi:MAG: hypothetical protein IKN64_05845 [Desulfovibrio sp.]|nr:hypothetical protein [Desulfovibrio sp.]
MASMKQCPYCQAENRQAAKKCWNCERDISTGGFLKMMLWAIIIFGIIGLLNKCGIM